MSSVAARWIRARYRRWRKAGLCGKCGKRRAREGAAVCGQCRARHKEYQENRRARLDEMEASMLWTDQDDKRLSEFIAAKFTPRQAALSLGRTSNAIKKRAFRIGLAFDDARPRPVWTPTKIAALEVMIGQGKPFRTIGRQLGVSEVAARWQAHARGLTKSPSEQLPAKMGDSKARCRCNLLLPCNSCIPTAVDFASARVDGGTVAVTMRLRAS